MIPERCVSLPVVGFPAFEMCLSLRRVSGKTWYGITFYKEATFTCFLGFFSCWHNIGNTEIKVTGWVCLFIQHLFTCIFETGTILEARHTLNKIDENIPYILWERNSLVVTCIEGLHLLILCHKLLTLLTLITTL